MKLFRNIVLWIVGMVAVMLGLVALGIPDRAAVAVGTGLLFAMIAHVGASTDWKRISQRDLLSRESWRGPVSPENGETRAGRQKHEDFEEQDAPRPLLEKLVTPAQRMLFAVGVLGAILTVGSMIGFQMTGRHYNLVEAILSHPYIENGYKYAFYIGVIVMSAGFVGAFWFEATVGRLLTWIRTGE